MESYPSRLSFLDRHDVCGPVCQQRTKKCRVCVCVAELYSVEAQTDQEFNSNVMSFVQDTQVYKYNEKLCAAELPTTMQFLIIK